MSQITYRTLKIEGLPISHITGLEIHQQINEHGKAVIYGEASPETAKKFMGQATEKMAIRIKHLDKTLFCGILEDLSVQYQNDYAVLCAKLISTTRALDCNIQSHSYQCTQATYKSIMEKSTCGGGDIVFRIQDKPTGKMIVQYRETAWAFIKRMAAECRTFIVADITALRPTVIVGDMGEAVFQDAPKQKGNGSESGATDEFIFAGTKKNGQIIISVDSVLKAGVLMTTYQTQSTEKVKTAVISMSQASQPSFAGKIFPATVKNVKKDLIQAHLITIDQEFDEGGDWWFPYSTLYSSSQNEAGIYCMPKKGDPVRIFFPTNEAKDGFAASSKTVRGNQSDKEEKCFQTQSGMEVLFAKEGLFISCKGKKIYINLDKQKGIELKANTSITMYTAKNFGIMAYENLKVKSKSNIFIGTPGSYMSIEEDGITTMAPKIFVK